MNNIEDGGPAFPTLDYITPDKIASNQNGMTLLDYFAAKAMQGMMARVGAHDADVVAHDAYIVAYAMLEEKQA